MKGFVNLSEVDTNTKEGRHLIAAVSLLSTFHSDRTTEGILDLLFQTQKGMYKNAIELEQMPTKEVDFEEALKDLINYYSKESRSNTPDFILAAFLDHCLGAFNGATNDRDKHFNFVPFGKNVLDVPIFVGDTQPDTCSVSPPPSHKPMSISALFNEGQLKALEKMVEMEGYGSVQEYMEHRMMEVARGAQREIRERGKYELKEQVGEINGVTSEHIANLTSAISMLTEKIKT